jgi:hypothetical protein
VDFRDASLVGRFAARWWLHGVGADGPGAGLGHAEVPDLARCDEFGDGAGDVLSRHVRVHPVLLVQVNTSAPTRRSDPSAACAMCSGR